MKNTVKGILITAVIFATAITLAACNKPSVEAVYISMDADTAQVQLGQTGQAIKFNAVVEGKNNPSQTVTWTVSSTADGTGEVANGTNISPSGTLNLSRTETAQSVFVRAASAQDAGKYDYVQINLASGTVTESRQRRNRQREDTQEATAQTASQETRPDTAETAAITPPTTETPNTNTATPATSTQPSTTASASQTATPTASISTTTQSASTQTTTAPVVQSTQTTVTTQTAAANTTPTAAGNFQVTSSGGTVTIAKYTGSGGAVNIPATINGMPVTGFEREAFISNTSITSITIPASVKNVGTTSMQGIGFTDIVTASFDGCTRLTAINVDSANTEYSSADGILYNKEKTKLIRCPQGKSGSVTIPYGVTSLEHSAFLECKSITSVTISYSVGLTSIGRNAFKACYSLTAVDIPATVTSIGDLAFNGCISLTSLTIPASIQQLEGWGVFSGCGNLTSVTFGTGKIFYLSGDRPVFDGDLRKKHEAGGRGTYTTANPGNDSIWTKQETASAQQAPAPVPVQSQRR